MLKLGRLSIIIFVFYLILLATLDSNDAVPIRKHFKHTPFDKILKSQVNALPQLDELYASQQVKSNDSQSGNQTNDVRAHAAYYPQRSNLRTVCSGRSTAYNIPRVLKYLRPEIIATDLWHYAGYHDFYKRRDLYMDLRQELHKQGKSEECHEPDMNTWRSYLECATRRNQRMEYLIPNYPLHQVHYHDLTGGWNTHY